MSLQHKWDGTRAGLDDRSRDGIGRALKRVYADVANEAVPDRILELLRRLDGDGDGGDPKPNGCVCREKS